jgi:hypothetical protein
MFNFLLSHLVDVIPCVLEQVGVDTLVLFEFFEVYPVIIVLVICLLDQGFGLLLVLAKDLFSGTLVSGLDQADEQFFEALTHRENKAAREQCQLVPIFYDVQILQLLPVVDQVLDVSNHVHPAIVGVCLPR